MFKILTLILCAAICFAYCDDVNTTLAKSPNNGIRQKRLLFYDEDGNLVKTFTNPYLKDFALGADKMPFYGNFMHPFFAFVRASYGGSSSAFTIPVSNEIVQKIQTDPEYQFKLAVVPKKEPVIAPNAFCQGKRTQVPSPEKCNNFLNCWDGWSFEQECPDGLLFSREGYCDYSYNVDCKNREILIKPVIQAPVQLQPEPQPQPSQPAPQPTIPQVPTQSQPSAPSSQPQLPCLQQTSPTPQLIPSEPKPQYPQPQPVPVQLPQAQPVPAQPPKPQPVPVQPPQPQPVPTQPPQPQLQPAYLSKCTEQYKTYRSPYNCKEFYICVDGKLDKYVCIGDLVFSQDAGLCFPRGLVDCGTVPVDNSATKQYSSNDNYKLDYVKIN